MNSSLYRSHETSLTDDELLLLDALFNACVTPAMLSKRTFGAQFNARPHCLTDSELATVIERWLNLGYAVHSPQICRGERCLELTEAGGHLWEIERRPLWDRYGIDRYNELPKGTEMMSFVSPSESCRDEFMATWLPAGARWRPWKIQSHKLIGWRRFQQLFVGTAAYAVEGGERTHSRNWWAEIDRKRTWWRDVRELQRFLTGGMTARPR